MKIEMDSDTGNVIVVCVAIVVLDIIWSKP